MKEGLGRKKYSSIIQVTIFVLCMSSVCVAGVVEFTDEVAFKNDTGNPQFFIDFETYGDGTPVPPGDVPVTGDEWLNLGIQFAEMEIGFSMILSAKPGMNVSPTNEPGHALAIAGLSPGNDRSSFLITFPTPVISFGVYIVDNETGGPGAYPMERIILKDEDGNIIGDFAMPGGAGPAPPLPIAHDFIGYSSTIPIAEVHLIEANDGEGALLDNVMYSVPEPPCEYHFVTEWGEYGTDDTQFNHPFGLATDAGGYVYVVDTGNHRVQKFTSTGDFNDTWGELGDANGQFENPYDIAFDSAGYAYVVDHRNNRVQKFTSDGTFVTKWGAAGTGDGQFNRPRGVVVDASGYVYVVDGFNHRVQKFTSDGTFVTKWGSGPGGGDNQFSYPCGIAVSSSGYVYVADTENSRIQKFTSNGTPLDGWYGLDHPYALDVDSSGYVYVADTENFRVVKLTESGGPVTEWGESGTGPGQFNKPSGIAVDQSGNVYVADLDNHRVQKFACLQPCWVEIDIKPESCPNPLNVKSRGNICVAILGSEDFDANAIDPAAVRLQGVAPLRSSLEDVATPVADGNECDCNEDGPDGHTDLTVKFDTQLVLAAIGDVNNGDVLQLHLTGVLDDGTAIQGTDCMVVVGNFKAFKKGDINKDGITDAIDFTLMAETWLESTIIQEE